MGTRHKVIERYQRLDVLGIDELGYLQLDRRGAELLFQVITEREEQSSLMVATNLPFSEWNGIFSDQDSQVQWLIESPSTPRSSKLDLRLFVFAQQ